jgi:hypothetical protein
MVTKLSEDAVSRNCGGPRKRRRPRIQTHRTQGIRGASLISVRARTEHSSFSGCRAQHQILLWASVFFGLTTSTTTGTTVVVEHVFAN